MAYISNPDDMFIRGASASGFIFELLNPTPPDPTLAQIQLPAPGSGYMYGAMDINGNANHVNKATILTLTPTVVASGYGTDGLYRTKHAGYMNDDVTYFDNHPRIADNNYGTSVWVDTFGGFGAQQLDYDEAYSLQWTGWFVAPETGNYNFYTISDDCSFLWMGDNAKHGNYTRANALVDNGGAHGARSVGSNVSVHLTAGQYYPFRLQFGEAGGGESCMVFYSNDAGQTKATYVAGKFKYDPVNTDLY
jgi:hypothetical protein